MEPGLEGRLARAIIDTEGGRTIAVRWGAGSRIMDGVTLACSGWIFSWQGDDRVAWEARRPTSTALRGAGAARPLATAVAADGRGRPWDAPMPDTNIIHSLTRPRSHSCRTGGSEGRPGDTDMPAEALRGHADRGGDRFFTLQPRSPPPPLLLTLQDSNTTCSVAQHSAYGSVHSVA